jgi:hypothetical protein
MKEEDIAGYFKSPSLYFIIETDYNYETFMWE